MKKMVFILILVFSLGVLGCAATDKRVEENTVGVQLLKGRTNDINEELDEISGKLNNLYAQVTEIDSRMERLAELREEAEALIGSMGNRTLRGPADLNVKVLSGDGNINSAKTLEKVLTQNGYVIKRVDMAPYDTFSRHTVFYAKGFREEAETVARVIGGRTITKPLTWMSIFDIIAVSGK